MGINPKFKFSAEVLEFLEQDLMSMLGMPACPQHLVRLLTRVRFLGHVFVFKTYSGPAPCFQVEAQMAVEAVSQGALKLSLAARLVIRQLRLGPKNEIESEAEIDPEGEINPEDVRS